jgi:hypothetical protein
VSREPVLHGTDHPVGVSYGRIGLLEWDVDGRVVSLVPAFEERSQKPSRLLVDLATADHEVHKRGDDT